MKFVAITATIVQKYEKEAIIALKQLQTKFRFLTIIETGLTALNNVSRWIIKFEIRTYFNSYDGKLRVWISESPLVHRNLGFSCSELFYNCFRLDTLCGTILYNMETASIQMLEFWTNLSKLM